MSEPMTEERIAELWRKSHRNIGGQDIRECLVEIESLQAHEPTWAELMKIIDKRYPPEVFGKGSDDNTGPRIVALCREIESLQAMVAKWPKTADDVPVVPGMITYCNHKRPMPHCWELRDRYGVTYHDHLEGRNEPREVEAHYSTEAAARAAGKESEVK